MKNVFTKKLLLIITLTLFAVQGSCANYQEQINRTIDIFLSSKSARDSEAIKTVSNPEGILVRTEEGDELISLQDVDEMFFASFSNKNSLENREIVKTDSGAKVSGYWIDGHVRPGREKMEAMKLDCDIHLFQLEDSWYVSKIVINGVEEIQRDTPPLPGTLAKFESDYFNIKYPPFWDVEEWEQEPSRFDPVIYNASFGLRQTRGRDNFSITIQVSERDFEDFDSFIDERFAQIVDHNKECEIVEKERYTIGNYPAARVFYEHLSFDDHETSTKTIITANDDYLISANMLVVSPGQEVEDSKIRMDRARIKALMDQIELK